MSTPASRIGALAVLEEEMVALERERTRVPQAIAEQEAKLAASQEAIASHRRAADEADKRRRAREAELEDLGARRGKLQAQSAQVKTNQEYTAMLHEIEAAARRMSELEDEILVAMDESDAARAALKTYEDDHRQVEKQIGQTIGELRVRLEAVEAALASRRADEEKLLAELDAQSRATYARVKRVRGTGTSRVRGRICSACNRDVPFETMNRIRAGELHACVNCARLLAVVPEGEAAGPTG
jgi:hypothetical protein